MDNKKYIIVMGPTGVGKSDLAIEAAQFLSGEIINGDVGQFYTPFGIGTAKPEWRNEPVTHHLFDVIDEPIDCTVVSYRSMVQNALDQVWSKKRIPLIVGGSGFYLQSLFFPPLSFDDADHAHVSEVSIDSSVEKTWHNLKKYDSERAAQIDPHDSYRIDRAFEFMINSGKKASFFNPIYNPLCGQGLVIFCARERTELYDRIDARVLHMMQSGWKHEVELLLDTPWENFLLRKKLIGYPDIIKYLRGDTETQDFESVVTEIQKKTRHYAKRQSTFWRAFEKKVQPYMINNNLVLKTVNLSLENSRQEFMKLIKDFCDVT